MKTMQKGKREAENNISVAPTTLLILFTQLPSLAKAFALLAYYPQKKFLIHVCNYILAIVYTFLKKKILKIRNKLRKCAKILRKC